MLFLAQTRTAHVPTYTALVLPNIAFQFKDFESVNDDYVVSIQKATSTSENNNIIDADFSFKMKTNLLLSTTHFTCFYDPTRMLGKCLAGVG